jgi:hypothetical protein
MKKFNTRGMNIEQIVAVAGKAIDEIVEESQTNFTIDILDDGYTVEDAEAIFESQRIKMAEWRKEALAEMRRLLSGGEHLNS